MDGTLRATRVLLVGEPTIGAVQFEAWPEADDRVSSPEDSSHRLHDPRPVVRDGPGSSWIVVGLVVPVAVGGPAHRRVVQPLERPVGDLTDEIATGEGRDATKGVKRRPAARTGSGAASGRSAFLDP